MKTRKTETTPNTPQPETKNEAIADFSGKLYFTVPYEKPIRRDNLKMFQSEPIVKKEVKQEENGKCLVM